jgi:hypothetical protein
MALRALGPTASKTQLADTSSVDTMNMCDLDSSQTRNREHADGISDLRGKSSVWCSETHIGIRPLPDKSLLVCTTWSALVYLILFPLKTMLNDLWSERVHVTQRAELSTIAEVPSNVHPGKRIGSAPRDPSRFASKHNQRECSVMRRTLGTEVNRTPLVRRQGQKK